MLEQNQLRLSDSFKPFSVLEFNQILPKCHQIQSDDKPDKVWNPQTFHYLHYIHYIEVTKI